MLNDYKPGKELEFRFYEAKVNKNTVFNRFNKTGFKYINSSYELTEMYDNPNPDYSFYNKKIDGRLRLRTVHNVDIDNQPINDIASKALISWKRRLPERNAYGGNLEEEVEFNISGNDIQSAGFVINSVLKCPRISSYERFRHTFEYKNNDQNIAQITLDEFPFGLMIEFEQNGNDINSKNYSFLLGVLRSVQFNIEQSSSLSCDDMYKELCLKKGVLVRSDIKFDDKDMPSI